MLINKYSIRYPKGTFLMEDRYPKETFLLEDGPMPELDGTAKHHEFLTPFDAHDKVLRDSSGYEHQEYPRAVDHIQKTDAPEGHYEPVIELND